MVYNLAQSQTAIFMLHHLLCYPLVFENPKMGNIVSDSTRTFLNGVIHNRKRNTEENAGLCFLQYMWKFSNGVIEIITKDPAALESKPRLSLISQSIFSWCVLNLHFTVKSSHSFCLVGILILASGMKWSRTQKFYRGFTRSYFVV